MSVRSPLGATPQTAGFELSTGALGARRARGASSRTRLGLIGLAGLLVTGLLITISAANTQALLPESIRPVPASLAGAFAGGLNLHPGGAIAVLSLMFISYLVAVAAAGQLSARAVLMSIAALHALVLLAPPLISTDIFSYQAYARIGATYGANPYLSGPHAIALDPVFPYIGAKWSYIPSVYGPVFTIFSYALAPLSIAASVGVYKSIAAVASLALVAIVWNTARVRGVNPVRAAALVGLNPLLVLYGVGGGHNDLLMLVASSAAIYAILASRERLGGALSILAVGIKLTAGLLLPFAIAAGGPGRGRDRRRDLLLGAGVVFALLVSLTVALYGTGALQLLGTVQHTQSLGDWHSLPGFVSTRLGLPTAGHVLGFVLAAAFVGVCIWLLRRVWRGRSDWIDAAGWATVAMLVAASSLLPWYVAWALPLAAVGTDRRLFRAVLVLTGVVLAVQMLGYIPHGGSSPFG
jgi:alpha-1,6-mannosyltransferase